MKKEKKESENEIEAISYFVELCFCDAVTLSKSSLNLNLTF